MRALSLVIGVLLATPAGAESPLTWSDGDHQVAARLESRLRFEGWDARAGNTDWFHVLRSRVGVTYSWRKTVSALFEFQDARIHGLDNDSSGAAAVYRGASGMDSHAASDRIRQLWIELRPVEDLRLRAGRQDIELGTEVMYPEPNWKYLKVARGSQRLVGTVGWTHVERSNDGGSASYDLGGHHIYLFGARPTTGVFDFDHAYDDQEDIQYGGLTWTVRRGEWVPNTELRFFGIGYRDDRKIPDPALAGPTTGNVNVYTVGFSSIGIYPLGPGNADLLIWGAYQWGDWQGSLDHQAWAALLEGGYQWPSVATKPWLRAGINAASGDRSATDGDHESFFNLLPTNHLYYGFADQLALANLLDYFVQLKLAPTSKTSVNAFLHHMYLLTDDDGRHFGTGAFNKTTFGYGFQPQTSESGHRSLGTELDIVASYAIHPNVSLQAGYSYMWGHAFFNHLSDDDTRFAYFQVTARY